MRLPGRWSIRARIALTATGVVALVLAVSGFALVRVHRTQLLANLDGALSVRADDVEAALDDGTPPTGLALEGTRDHVIQVVDGHGTVLVSTAGLTQPVADPPSGVETYRDFPDLPLEDDGYRVLSRRVSTTSGELVIHVAENTDDLLDSIRTLSWSLVTVFPLVSLVLGTVVWWLTGRTLRPVEAIRAEMAELGATELHRRVPVPATGDEVAQLAETMNAMLDRLEEATARQHRFVADASHELRSPLTRMRADIELALAGIEPTSDTDPHGARATLATALADTSELQTLVADLLQLARSDARASGGDSIFVPVDLDDLVLRETRRLRDDERRVDVGQVSAAQVLGDPTQLPRAVRNLLDNAARHADHTVTVGLQEIAGWSVLTVADDGSGVAVAERERIFERFGRVDDARTRAKGGTGLGLAIARDIARRHGGDIVLDQRPDDRGARFVLRLPTAP